MRIIVLLFIITWAPAQVLAGENLSIQRWAKGSFDYRRLSSGESWGSEAWHLTVHPDGSRTMQTRNRMEASGVQRHVTLRVAENFRPLEVTAVYFVKGQWRGTGLFAVNGDQLRAIVNTPDGIVEQNRSVPENFSFIPHPLATNAWGNWYYDREKGGLQQQLVYDMDSRAGSVSSMMGKMYEQTVEFMGEEEMMVPAGTFLTRHFRVNDDVDIYLTGPDDILVRFVWHEADNDFVLTSLETGE